MKNLIISTVGTSLITNPASKDKVVELYKYSNCSEEECPEIIKGLIGSLVPIIKNKLRESNINEIRRISAELNGIYGFYNNDLNNRKNDIHFLISTNTYQGLKSAEVVCDYLKTKNIICDIFTPHNLSTKNKENFSEGIKDILKWFDETISGYKEKGYTIIFNLTGGFKSLQGYLNTLAMFYADKIVYIFESEQSELIEIPRLPVRIDLTPFKKNKVKLLLLNANKIFKSSEFEELPEAIFDQLGDEVILSVWGDAIWKKIKSELFDSLPEIPFITYNDKFRKMYSELIDKSKKTKLIETIAKVSVILESSNGAATELSKGGIQFSPLESKKYDNKPLYHFRTDLGIRINCVKTDKGLLLTEFGTHDQTQ